MNTLSDYIINKKMKEFNILFYFDNGNPKELCNYKHKINFEYDKNDNFNLSCIFESYNKIKISKMCLVKELNSFKLVDNYIKNEEIRNACLLGSKIGVCVIVHDNNYLIEEILWIINKKVVLNINNNENTKKYFRYIIELIIEERQTIEIHGIINYEISKNNEKYFIEDSTQKIDVLRGNVIKFNNVDKNFVLYDEKDNEIKFNRINNNVLLETNDETPKKIYYNKYDKYNYIKLRDGLYDVIKRFFTYVLKNNQAKVQEYIKIISSIIIHKINFDEEDFTCKLIEDLLEIGCQNEEKEFSSLDFIDLIISKNNEKTCSKLIAKILKCLKKEDYKNFDHFVDLFCKHINKINHIEYEEINIDDLFYYIEDKMTKVKYSALSKKDKICIKSLFFNYAITKKEFNMLILNTIENNLINVEFKNDLNLYIKELVFASKNKLYKKEITSEEYELIHKKVISDLYDTYYKVSEYVNKLCVHISNIITKYENTDGEVINLKEILLKIDILKKKNKEEIINNILNNMEEDILFSIEKNQHNELLHIINKDLFEIENQLYKEIDPKSLLEKIYNYSKFYQNERFACLLRILEALIYNGIEESILYNKIDFYFYDIHINEKYKIPETVIVDKKTMRKLKSEIDVLYYYHSIENNSNDYLFSLIIESFQDLVVIFNEKEIIIPKDTLDIVFKLVNRTLNNKDIHLTYSEDIDDFGNLKNDHFNSIDENVLLEPKLVGISIPNISSLNNVIPKIKIPKIKLPKIKLPKLPKKKLAFKKPNKIIPINIKSKLKSLFKRPNKNITKKETEKLKLKQHKNIKENNNKKIENEKKLLDQQRDVNNLKYNTNQQRDDNNLKYNTNQQNTNQPDNQSNQQYNNKTTKDTTYNQPKKEETFMNQYNNNKEIMVKNQPFYNKNDDDEIEEINDEKIQKQNLMEKIITEKKTYSRIKSLEEISDEEFTKLLIENSDTYSDLKSFLDQFTDYQ